MTTTSAPGSCGVTMSIEDDASGRLVPAMTAVTLLLAGCASGGGDGLPAADEHVSNGLLSACQPIDGFKEAQYVVSPGVVVLEEGEQAEVEVKAVVTKGPQDALVGVGIGPAVVDGDTSRNGFGAGGALFTPDAQEEFDIHFGPVELEGPGKWSTVVVTTTDEPLEVVVPARSGNELFTLTLTRGDCPVDASTSDASGADEPTEAAELEERAADAAEDEGASIDGLPVLAGRVWDASPGAVVDVYDNIVPAEGEDDLRLPLLASVELEEDGSFALRETSDGQPLEGNAMLILRDGGEQFVYYVVLERPTLDEARGQAIVNTIEYARGGSLGMKVRTGDRAMDVEALSQVMRSGRVPASEIVMVDDDGSQLPLPAVQSREDAGRLSAMIEDDTFGVDDPRADG